MTNLEYLVSKNKLDFGDLCFLAHLSKYNRTCDGKSCSECEFSRNVQRCVEAILAEHKEKIKLTKNEKAILESLEDKYKWIARAKSGSLYIFENKPFKKYGVLSRDGACNNLFGFKNIFQFIKFEDKEPYNIQELLANCEVEE